MLNDYYKNINLDGFINRYGIANAIRRGIYIANPIHYVKNYETKKLLWQEKAARKVAKYIKYCVSDPNGLSYGNIKVFDPVWVYWNTGIENAPPIVKKCYDSIKRYSNREVVLLNDGNVGRYIQLPEYIENKKKEHHISLAGYTDLMRFALLEHFGGIWIDSTVYLTENIPEQILDSDFFAFRNALGLLENPVLYPAWFLRAKQHNDVIRKIRNVAFAYWKHENHIIEYLLPNLIITQVLKLNPSVEKEMPYLNSDYSEYLVKLLGDLYSIDKWNWITDLTGIHKLTYKLDPSIDKNDSFYRWILEH